MVVRRTLRILVCIRRDESYKNLQKVGVLLYAVDEHLSFGSENYALVQALWPWSWKEKEKTKNIWKTKFGVGRVCRFCEKSYIARGTGSHSSCPEPNEDGR